MIDTKMPKNKITTQGYFIRRLRNSGYIVSRVYDRYSEEDKRKWTIAINPEVDSIFITCVDHGEWPYRGMYHVDDGGDKFPINLYINTDSIDVILKHLDEFKVSKLETGRRRRVNNKDE